MALNLAVIKKNLVAVKGPVLFATSGSECLQGSGNTVSAVEPRGKNTFLCLHSITYCSLFVCICRSGIVLCLGL
jgi:hypothetical protein